jgi:alkylation response protein AidB-like acyl-CoA dehydrogenase
MGLRHELRAWLAAHVTPEVVEAGRRPVTDETLGTLRAWNRELADAGWAAPTWPVEHGGRAAGLDDEVAYYEEMAAARAPGPINVIGVANIAPAIMAYGSAEQQARFLRPLLRGDEIWSQGMSEPDSGSDLASLRTRAEPDGADFVVNGQKTWNSLGHLADWCQLYVRTDPGAPKHRGISCLLVDLRSPGVEVRPLRTMSGEVSFSELFFSDVRVPTAALLGPLHAGWDVAMNTLSHERAGVARLHLALRNKLDALLAEPAAQAALGDRRRRQRVAQVWSQIACMRWTTERSLAQLRSGPTGRGSGQHMPSGTAGSLAKLAWSRADQALAELAVDVLGLGALAGEWAYNLASSPSTSIAGGTTEINRNIVAEQGLGLPRG